MVRLKESQKQGRKSVVLFQFQYGTIKSIMLELIVLHFNLSFNSNMVRLKEKRTTMPQSDITGFNSNMVRLKDQRRSVKTAII